MSWLSDTTQDYRRGFVEGQACHRDVYLLKTGAANTSEYERGFADGMRTVEEGEVDE